jgi:hypothetical protein
MAMAKPRPIHGAGPGAALFATYYASVLHLT